MGLTEQERREVSEAVAREAWTSPTLVDTILDRVDTLMVEHERRAAFDAWREGWNVRHEAQQAPCGACMECDTCLPDNPHHLP